MRIVMELEEGEILDQSLEQDSRTSSTSGNLPCDSRERSNFVSSKLSNRSRYGQKRSVHSFKEIEVVSYLERHNEFPLLRTSPKSYSSMKARDTLHFNDNEDRRSEHVAKSRNTHRDNELRANHVDSEKTRQKSRKSKLSDIKDYDTYCRWWDEKQERKKQNRKRKTDNRKLPSVSSSPKHTQPLMNKLIAAGLAKQQALTNATHSSTSSTIHIISSPELNALSKETSKPSEIYCSEIIEKVENIDTTNHDEGLDSDIEIISVPEKIPLVVTLDSDGEEVENNSNLSDHSKAIAMVQTTNMPLYELEKITDDGIILPSSEVKNISKSSYCAKQNQPQEGLNILSELENISDGELDLPMNEVECVSKSAHTPKSKATSSELEDICEDQQNMPLEEIKTSPLKPVSDKELRAPQNKKAPSKECRNSILESLSFSESAILDGALSPKYPESEDEFTISYSPSSPSSIHSSSANKIKEVESPSILTNSTSPKSFSSIEKSNFTEKNDFQICTTSSYLVTKIDNIAVIDSKNQSDIFDSRNVPTSKEQLISCTNVVSDQQTQVTKCYQEDSDDEPYSPSSTYQMRTHCIENSFKPFLKEREKDDQPKSPTNSLQKSSLVTEEEAYSPTSNYGGTSNFAQISSSPIVMPLSTLPCTKDLPPIAMSAEILEGETTTQTGDLDKSDDEDISHLRKIALSSKGRSSKSCTPNRIQSEVDNHVSQSSKYTDDDLDNEDEDILKLRVAALKSAVMKKHEERKKRGLMVNKKIVSNSALEDDIIPLTQGEEFSSTDRGVHSISSEVKHRNMNSPESLKGVEDMEIVDSDAGDLDEPCMNKENPTYSVPSCHENQPVTVKKYDQSNINLMIPPQPYPPGVDDYNNCSVSYLPCATSSVVPEALSSKPSSSFTFPSLLPPPPPPPLPTPLLASVDSVQENSDFPSNDVVTPNIQIPSSPKSLTIENNINKKCHSSIMNDSKLNESENQVTEFMEKISQTKFGPRHNLKSIPLVEIPPSNFISKKRLKKIKQRKKRILAKKLSALGSDTTIPMCITTDFPQEKMIKNKCLPSCSSGVPLCTVDVAENTSGSYLTYQDTCYPITVPSPAHTAIFNDQNKVKSHNRTHLSEKTLKFNPMNFDNDEEMDLSNMIILDEVGMSPEYKTRQDHPRSGDSIVNEESEHFLRQQALTSLSAKSKLLKDDFLKRKLALKHLNETKSIKSSLHIKNHPSAKHSGKNITFEDFSVTRKLVPNNKSKYKLSRVVRGGNRSVVQDVDSLKVMIPSDSPPPPLSPPPSAPIVNKLVIRVNEDSDSEEESEWQRRVRIQEHPITKAPDHNNEYLERSIDMLLLNARKNVETPTSSKSISKPSIEANTCKRTISRDNSAKDDDTLDTPLQYLPRERQEEYQRLKKLLEEKEKLISESKKSSRRMIAREKATLSSESNPKLESVNRKVVMTSGQQSQIITNASICKNKTPVQSKPVVMEKTLTFEKGELNQNSKNIPVKILGEKETGTKITDKGNSTNSLSNLNFVRATSGGITNVSKAGIRNSPNTDTVGERLKSSESVTKSRKINNEMTSILDEQTLDKKWEVLQRNNKTESYAPSFEDMIVKNALVTKTVVELGNEEIQISPATSIMNQTKEDFNQDLPKFISKDSVLPDLEKLVTAQEELLCERFIIVDELTEMSDTLSKLEQGQEELEQAVVEINRLRDQLQAAEQRLHSKHQTTQQLEATVFSAHQSMFTRNQRIKDLENTCSQIGTVLRGANYVIPNRGKELMERKVQQFIEKRDKIKFKRKWINQYMENPGLPQEELGPHNLKGEVQSSYNSSLPHPDTSRFSPFPVISPENKTRTSSSVDNLPLSPINKTAASSSSLNTKNSKDREITIKTAFKNSPTTPSYSGISLSEIESLSKSFVELNDQLDLKSEPLNQNCLHNSSKLSIVNQDSSRSNPDLSDEKRKLLVSTETFLLENEVCTKRPMCEEESESNQPERKKALLHKESQFPTVNTKRDLVLCQDLLNKSAEINVSTSASRSKLQYRSVLQHKTHSRPVCIGTSAETVVCPYDLSGECHDPSCKFQHISTKVTS